MSFEQGRSLVSASPESFSPPVVVNNLPLETLLAGSRHKTFSFGSEFLSLDKHKSNEISVCLYSVGSAEARIKARCSGDGALLDLECPNEPSSRVVASKAKLHKLLIDRIQALVDSSKV